LLVGVRNESLALFGDIEYVLVWSDEYYQQVVVPCLDSVGFS
jgi:hypothetical protein